MKILRKKENFLRNIFKKKNDNFSFLKNYECNNISNKNFNKFTFNFTTSEILNKKQNPTNLKNYKTALYLWNSSVNPGMKKADIKSRLNLSYEPTRISYFDDKLIKYMYCGIRHSGVLTEDGNLYMFGKNPYGNLGVGNNEDVNYYEPKLVTYFEENNIKIKKFCCGEYNTIALSEDGDVYTCGYGGRRSKYFALIKGIICIIF